MAATVSCKICGEPTSLDGTVEFNRNCDIPRRREAAAVRHAGALPVPIAGACNEDYAAVDPECAEARPRNNAAAVVALFGVGRSERRVLDYGGGNDALCAQLRAADFRSP
jgi:hypothetical protein